MRDALVMGPWHGHERIEGHRRPPGDYTGRGMLVRTATCISGQVDLMLDCMPLFDYGRHSGTWSYQGPGYGVASCVLGGIWEVRGEPQHFTASKVMCWVAVDRGAKLAGGRGEEDLAARWRAEADRIHGEICAHGIDQRGVFVQTFGGSALDASLLLVPLMGFLPPQDDRVRATVLAIADELSIDGLVLRYRPAETDDGLEGEEGTFTICSFWLVSALAMIGEIERAAALCPKLLSLASPLQLYAEEIDAESGRHLGNFPQAFTHLALIDAVLRVIAAEGAAAVT